MTTAKPNVLLIMADQMRFDYVGYAGGDHVHTPHLDRLAAEGMVFTHCCSNSPVCAPARIGLATGMNPSRLGALSNAAYLPARAPTYYQRLRDHGFRVGCVGKLDLAKPDNYNGRYGDRPLAYSWGFTHPEECEGKIHAGRGNPPNGPYTNWLQEQGLLETFTRDYAERNRRGRHKAGATWDSPLPTEAFEDSYIGRRAAEWLEWVPNDFPWHYFVSFVGPHNPFDPPTEYADRYRHADMPSPIVDPMDGKPASVEHNEPGSKAATPEEVLEAQRQYCGAITLIDDAIGRILDVLDRRGLRENTYVLFTSDHGEMLYDHGLWCKNTFHEGAFRLPLLAAGPGIAPGRTDALVELIDVNPTICDLAGVGPEPDIDARSFAPILRGQTDAIRTEVVGTLSRSQCVRNHDYKLIFNANDVTELYDLRRDPQELSNIAEAHPELVQELARALRARLLEGGCRR